MVVASDHRQEEKSSTFAHRQARFAALGHEGAVVVHDHNELLAPEAHRGGALSGGAEDTCQFPQLGFRRHAADAIAVRWPLTQPDGVTGVGGDHCDVTVAPVLNGFGILTPGGIHASGCERSGCPQPRLGGDGRRSGIIGGHGLAAGRDQDFDRVRSAGKIPGGARGWPPAVSCG